VVQVWAVEDDWDPAELESNTFELEWPPRSGRRQTFPEIDRAEWFSIPVARQKILKARLPSCSIGSQKSLAGQTTDDYGLRGLSRSRTASWPLGRRVVGHVSSSARVRCQMSGRHS
jgi:hypothetical protein